MAGFPGSQPPKVRKSGKENFTTDRNRIILAGVCLLFAVAHRLPAQGNTAEVYGGYTYANANPETPLARTGMSGWNVGAGGYATNWFGVAFEASAVFGSVNAPAASGVSGTALNDKEYSYVVGPQFRFLDTKRVQSSLKFMVGGVFGQSNLGGGLSSSGIQALSTAGYNTFNETKFAMLIAVPVDVSVTRWMALRVQPGVYMTGFAPLAGGGSVYANQQQWNFRISVGPVFRIGRRE
jgi:hypothetical protein